MTARTHIERGESLFANGQRKEALLELLVAEQLATEPEVQLDAMTRAGFAYLGIDDHTQAMSQFEKVIKEFPTVEGGYFNLSGLYIAHGQISDAEETLKKGVKNIPANGNIQLYLSFIYFQGNRREEALVTLESALSDFKSTDVGLTLKLAKEYLGTALRHQDPRLPTEHITQFKEALFHLAQLGYQIAPDDPDILFRYGDFAETLRRLWGDTRQ